MQINNRLALFAVLVFAAFGAQGATSIVYSNATSYTGTILNPGLNQVGDEIILGAGDRFGESFRFEYYGSNFSGNETVTLRFFNNDGVDIGNNTLKPNSVFFESLNDSLPTPIDISGRSTLQYDLNFVGLPDRFTFAITFGGITGGEVAGISLYHPPTVGLSENDYWFNTGSDWELRGTNVPINFGASLVATSVPEPSTYALVIIGGLCGLALVNRRRRTN